MKKSSIIFLKILVMLIGIGALVFMLWEPHLEGRNVNATVYQIYFNDPFLAYAYTASLAFFVAIYKIFKLLGYIENNQIFSENSVKALHTIKYCVIILIIFLLGAELYFFTIQRVIEDDITGGVAMGLFMIIISIIVATIASKFEKRLKKR